MKFPTLGESNSTMCLHSSYLPLPTPISLSPAHVVCTRSRKKAAFYYYYCLLFSCLPFALSPAVIILVVRMPQVINDIKLDFKDVLLRPKRSSLKSRADVRTV